MFNLRKNPILRRTEHGLKGEIKVEYDLIVSDENQQLE